MLCLSEVSTKRAQCTHANSTIFSIKFAISFLYIQREGPIPLDALLSSRIMLGTKLVPHAQTFAVMFVQL